MDGAEYETARTQANRVNDAAHRAAPSLKGKHIHEIHPVKFGGDQTDWANKAALDPATHREITAWWTRLQQTIEKLNWKP
jgi:hypothetical protein